jgi:hypothetical protein
MSPPESFVSGRAFKQTQHSHSIQPVFDPQSWHRFEIREVASEQSGIVSQADAGDFQILSADLLAERYQRIEAVRGIVILGKHQPGCEHLDLPDEALVGCNLCSRLGASADFREPTAQGFLDGDRGHGGVLIRRVEFLKQTQTRSGAVGQFTDVIGIKDEHAC